MQQEDHRVHHLRLQLEESPLRLQSDMVGVVSYTRDFQLLRTDLDSISGFTFHDSSRFFRRLLLHSKP